MNFPSLGIANKFAYPRLKKFCYALGFHYLCRVMAHYTGIGKRIIPAAAALLLASCSNLTDAVDASQTKILANFKQQGIYERNNIPEETPPASVKGYYDVIKGAYRHITNENREGRENAREISAGDVVTFYFDARIFGSSYDNSTTYFTNIDSRIQQISSSNPEFDASEWSSDPLQIKVGYDTGILKSIQNALPSCRAGDEIRIYLPPDVAYGSKGDGVVPAKSTLLFELTNIEIIE